MTRDHNTLREAGEALYGPLWQSQLARELDVADRTMRRWSSGQIAVPDGAWAEIAALCRRRGITLETLANRLQEGREKCQ